MYKPGDKVVYGVHGVCEIVDMTTQTVDRKKREYYVLQPLGQVRDRFFVPVDNQVALSKMRQLLTRSELEALLKAEHDDQSIWIVDENHRKQRFRELIASGDREVLICVIQALYKHKINQLAGGKKFHLSDENYLRDAMRLLSSEVAFVLGITPKDAIDYLTEKLCNESCG